MLKSKHAFYIRITLVSSVITVVTMLSVVQTIQQRLLLSQTGMDQKTESSALVGTLAENDAFFSDGLCSGKTFRI